MLLVFSPILSIGEHPEGVEGENRARRRKKRRGDKKEEKKR